MSASDAERGSSPGDPEALGRLMSAARVARGLTQQAIADALRSTATTVGRWERGENTPNALDFLRYASLVEMNLRDLARLAKGAAPLFPAWEDFLATVEGREASEDELRALASVDWPDGREPTVAAYATALAAVRMARPAK